MNFGKSNTVMRNDDISHVIDQNNLAYLYDIYWTFGHNCKTIKS